MHCIAYGDDISKIPSKRRSLCSDSVDDPGPRKQALCAWISLLSKQLQLQGISIISDTTIDQENPGRMCKSCFTQFWNYQKLLTTQFEKNLSLALRRFDLTDSKISECAGEGIHIISTAYTVDCGILHESPKSYIN